MPGADALELVKAHLRAEGAQGVEAVLATFSDDCVHRIHTYGIRVNAIGPGLVETEMTRLC